MGENNHRYFFLFVVYSWIATAYAVILSIHPYFYCGHAYKAVPDTRNQLNPESTTTSHNDEHPCDSWTDFKPKLVIFAVGSFIILSVFLIFILYLLATDTTTIEFISFSSPRRKREDMLKHYRVKGLGFHLQRVLGPVPYWARYLLPIPPLQNSIPIFKSSDSNVMPR